MAKQSPQPPASEPSVYTIAYARVARKFLEDMDETNPEMHDKIYGACQELAMNPRPQKAIKMEPKKDKKFRLEIWPYRAIYYIDDAARIVKIADIDHRRQVYR
jgi:mRNA-degrading endonuclease RelE of RelBE toxin-antitoxin system